MLSSDRFENFSGTSFIKVYIQMTTNVPWPCVHTSFRIRIKIRIKLKIILPWTFLKTYNDYLTIDYWYLIKYERKGNKL